MSIKSTEPALHEHTILDDIDQNLLIARFRATIHGNVSLEMAMSGVSSAEAAVVLRGIAANLEKPSNEERNN